MNKMTALLTAVLTAVLLAAPAAPAAAATDSDLVRWGRIDLDRGIKAVKAYRATEGTLPGYARGNKIVNRQVIKDRPREVQPLWNSASYFTKRRYFCIQVTAGIDSIWAFDNVRGRKLLSDWTKLEDWAPRCWALQEAKADEGVRGYETARAAERLAESLEGHQQLHDELPTVLDAATLKQIGFRPGVEGIEVHNYGLLEAATEFTFCIQHPRGGFRVWDSTRTHPAVRVAVTGTCPN